MLGLVLAFLSSSPCAAQAVYGSIVGRVSDPSGAVIKGASVSGGSSPDRPATRTMPENAGFRQLRFSTQ